MSERDSEDSAPEAHEEEEGPRLATPVTQTAADRFEAEWVTKASKHAWLVIPLLVPVALVVGMIQGAQAAILVLIAAALVSVIALFWSSVRTLLGETPLSGADAYALAAPRAEEEQKQAVLRALKDLEFERGVGKISEDDYAALVTKYRAEAKRLLRALDDEARPRRERAQSLVQARLHTAGLGPPPEPPKPPTPPSPFAPKAEAKTEAKKAKKKKSRSAEKPSEGGTLEIVPAAAPEPEKPVKANVESTLKSVPTKTKESPAYVPPSKTCSECGAKNDPDANFCKKCGSKVFGDGKSNVEVREANGDRVSGKPSDKASNKPADKPSEEPSSEAEGDAAADDAAAEETAR